MQIGIVGPGRMGAPTWRGGWRHGSVVHSWLLDLCAEILQRDEELQSVAPVVADSGAGRWTALESVELGVPAPVITMALMARFSSQGKSDYARKLLAERLGCEFLDGSIELIRSRLSAARLKS